MDGAIVTALILVVLVINAGLLTVTWRITRSNRRSLEVLLERERRANVVLHDAAVDRGHVLTLVHDHKEVA